MSRTKRSASISIGLAVIFVVVLGASLAFAVLSAEGRLLTVFALPDAASVAVAPVSITLPDRRDAATMATHHLPERVPAATNHARPTPSAF